MDRKDAMSAAVDLLATIVRNIRLRRELSKACPEPHLNFWRVIYGNCTDTAVQDSVQTLVLTAAVIKPSIGRRSQPR